MYLYLTGRFCFVPNAPQVIGSRCRRRRGVPISGAARYTMQEARDERLIMFFPPSKRAMRRNGTWESSRRPVTSSSSPVST